MSARTPIMGGRSRFCRNAIVCVMWFGGACLAEPTNSDRPTATVYVGVEARVRYTVPHVNGIPVLLRAADPPSLQVRPDVTVRIVSRRELEAATEFELGVLCDLPGEVDVAPLLRVVSPAVEDGSATALPALRVNVWTSLPEAHDGLLHEPPIDVPVRTARYVWMVGLVFAVWLIPLVVLAVRRVTRSRSAPALTPPAREPTLTELLRPLVERARGGQRDPDLLAQIERLMLRHWRRRLGLEGLSAAEALPRVRSDAACVALLTTVERWLHAPVETSASEREIDQLLLPFASDSDGRNALQNAGGVA